MSEAQTSPAPDAAPPTAGGTLLGGSGGAEARSWLPEEYRSDPTFKDLADVNALAKGYKHAASLVGVDKAEIVRIPREGDIPAETRSALLSRLGMVPPETPDGYKIEAPEGVRAEAVPWFQQTAHKLGLSPQQASGVLAELPALQQMVAQQEQQAVGEAVSKLREQWGAAYDGKVARIEQLAQQRMGEGGFEAVNALVKGGHLEALNLLASAADLMLEKPGLTGVGQGGGQVMTPEDAKGEINKLMRDADFQRKLGDRDHADHADALRRWDELHGWAFSTEPRRMSRPAA